MRSQARQASTDVGGQLRRVVLPGTTLAVSRLGFGTSGLMARLDRAASLRLLAAAVDAGITHFDTARLYGYGEAEGVLGEFLVGRRNGLTVASKAGILPPRRSRGLGLAKTVARRVATLAPPLRAVLRRRAEAMVQSCAFDVPALETSLHTSLRELKTDRLDVLFLHDCAIDDLDRPELLAFLERCQRDGKFLYFGVASGPEVCAAAHRRPGFASAVLQYPASAGAPHTGTVTPSGDVIATITHSALGASFLRACEQLGRDSGLAARWSEALGIDAGDRHALGAVFLTYACSANPAGCVLFSSTSEANIRRNSLIAERAPQYQAAAAVLPACLAALQS